MPARTEPKRTQRAAPAGKKKAAPKPMKKSASKRGKSADGTGEAESAPTLLSGGNPQIPKGDGDGPVQAYIDAMPGWKRAVGEALDALVVKTVPQVRKAVRWNSPFYGVEGQGWFLSFHCFNRYVKLTFLNGSSLNPLPPGASKHPHTRYFDIHENQPIDEELLTSWFKQAAKLPGEPLF